MKLAFWMVLALVGVMVSLSFIPCGEGKHMANKVLENSTYKVAVYSGGKEIRRFTSIGKPLVNQGVIIFNDSLDGEVKMVSGTVVVEKF